MSSVFQKSIVYQEPEDARHFVIKFVFASAANAETANRLLKPFVAGKKQGRPDDDAFTERIVFANEDRHRVQAIVFGAPGTPSSPSSCSSESGSESDSERDIFAPAYTRGPVGMGEEKK